MRAQILDVEALRSVSPAALAAFARSEGWVKSDVFGLHADVYSAESKPEIILPRTDRLADYAATVSRLIRMFAEENETDELATYRDLIGADRDVVRVRAYGGDDDGSVQLDAGVKIVAQSRDMLLAAACAARAPQALYRAGANKEAIEYMRRVKLGQTEHGSFVVTLLAPVPPLLQPQLDPSWVSLDDEPMERMVTRRLMSSLEASRSAAEMALSGDGDAFENAVASGVSANLCEAVANLIEQSNGLDISLTWARTRPTPEALRKVIFSVNDAEILKEAARTFRLRQPKPDVTLYGSIHKLKRDQEEVEGVVTLKTIIDDKSQSVSAVLDQATYAVAVQAHKAQTQVIVTGDLERIGQRWQMTNASVRELPSETDVEEALDWAPDASDFVRGLPSAEENDEEESKPKLASAQRYHEDSA
jgi:hypothetical protein